MRACVHTVCLLICAFASVLEREGFFVKSEYSADLF